MSEVIFTIGDFSIKKNSIYKIENKLDLEAPSGLQEEGTTKVPDESVFDSIQCRYIVDHSNPGEGLWDTGFYTSSPCYTNVGVAETTKQVENLVTNLVEPYEKAYGIDKLLNTNESFWSSYNITLKEGRVFNTNNVRDLLDLYIAIHSFKLTPKGADYEGNPKFAKSSYVVVDKAHSKVFKDDVIDNEMTAIATLVTGLKTDRALVLACLGYLKINFTSDVQDNTIKTTFSSYLKADKNNSKVFNALYSKTEDEDFVTELYIYRDLKELFETGKVKKAKGGLLYFEDIQIGADLKEASRNINSKQEFSKVKEQLLLGD